MSARKLVIIAAAFLVVVLVYIISVNLIESNAPEEIFGTKNIEPDKQIEADSNTLGIIGDLGLGKLEQANYVIRDKQTKKISRIFGFSKLIRQTGENWELEKPHLKMFEKNFTCNLTADAGVVQVEIIGSQPTPKDSQLNGNVVITIQSEQSDAEPSYIYLDDVIFNSQNSQFSSEGKVHFVSQDAEMVGTGLELIYNNLFERLELLHIIDLDFVHIKSKREHKKQTTADAVANNNNDNNINNTDNTALAKNEDIETPSDIDDEILTVQEPEINTDKPLYKCIFKDNVVIKKSNQFIYADQVALNNILLSNSQSSSSESKNTTDKEIAQTNNPAPKTAESPSNAAISNKDNTVISKTANTTDDDIIVKCKGGIIMRPMEYYKNQSSNRTIEFTGKSVEIKKQNHNKNDRLETIAQCSRINYDIDDKILCLKPDLNKFVSLFFEQADSLLKTTGDVEFYMTQDKALIKGPGKIFESSQENALEKFSFDGDMQIHFANNIERQLDNAEISYIDIQGGIKANQLNNENSNISADAAKIVFNTKNKINNLKLAGDVNMQSKSGLLKAPSANIYFDKQDNPLLANNIDFIEFDNGMVVESKTDNKGSNVAADNGLLYFAQNQQLKEAKLKGNVFVDTEKGLMLAENATVEFDKDPNGRIVATKVNGSGNAQIRPESNNSNKGSFTAQTIDYDLLSGTGTAKGPVKFVFWTTDTIGENTQKQYPMIITAQDDAIFSSTKKQIQLSGDVVGHIRQDKDGFFEESYFYADRMNVYLENAEKNNDLFGKSSLEKITLLGSKVRLNSQRTKDSQRISAVELLCKKLNYDALNKIITAIGSQEVAEIQIDNSNAVDESNGSNKITMKRPSYALIKNFDTLKWFLEKNRVEADGDMKRLYAGFLPVKPDGTVGDKSIVNCGRVEAVFTQSEQGKNEISTVLATKGINFEDKKYQFEGGNLFYETGSNFVRITGSPGRNCLFNGAVVDAIEYNLQTGKATAEIGQTPGTIQLR